MIAKYSRGVDAMLPRIVTDECLLLVHKTTPLAPIHLFSIRTEKNDLIIHHSCPGVNFEYEMHHSSQYNICDEINLVVLVLDKRWYVLLSSEYQSLSK